MGPTLDTTALNMPGPDAGAFGQLRPLDSHRSSEQLLRPIAPKEFTMASSPTLVVKCKPYFRLRSKTPRFQPKSIVSADLAAPPAPWNVPSLCAAYIWPTALPGNGVIAIVELGGGWVQSDMDAFFGSLNQPTPQITDVSVDGTQNSPNQSVGSSNDADYE